MPASRQKSSSSAVHGEAAKASSAAATAPRDVLHGLRCTPSRRSLKFASSPHARHFLAFDTAISREERLVLFMELFVFRAVLVDAAVLPTFQTPPYTPAELVEVRVVSDPRHPAFGQAGLYAKSAIPHNTIVTPYAGFIEVFATSCNSRTYTMGFGSIGDDYALDAEFVGNYGRYANDPRGVGALQANLSAENRFNARGESYTALVSRRQISAGEEILMSYGKAHRLSATPWMTMQGDAMMRPRVGGVVPFPSFCTEERPAHGWGKEEGQAGGSGARASHKQEEKEEGKESLSATRDCVRTGSSLEGSSSVNAAKHSSGGATTAPPAALSERGPPFSMANDVLWECTQCGMWTLCDTSSADCPQPCSSCKTPKLSGARMVALLSSPAITQEALLRESAAVSAHEPESTPPSSSPSPATAATTTAAAAAAGFSSEPADWPMNVPFLPWQVWDAAVPLSVLAKHSRFETQEHMFLYAVDTGIGEERKRSRSRTPPLAGVKSESSAAVKREEDSDEQTAWSAPQLESQHQETALPAAARASSSRPAHEQATARNSRRNAGGSGSRLKSGGLWERQGDVDPEQLAKLNRTLVLGAPLDGPSPALEASSGAPAALDGADRSSTAVSASKPSSPIDESDCKRDTANSSGGSGRARLSSSCTTAPPPSLPLLLAENSQVDRLLVVHRRWSPRVATASRGGGDDDGAYSPQLTLLRHRLRCMTRRLFTGKHFNTGDVVSYVGGLVRLRGDSRCRIADSCLEIPLRYFLPPALRVLCQQPASQQHCNAGQTQGGSQSSGGAGGGDGVEGIDCCDEQAGETAVLHRFCRRLDAFSLVVTNEFMYCPCVVYDGGVRRPKERASAAVTAGAPGDGGAEAEEEDDDDVERALAACNVALVLTLDSLGCPYACAVATKPIGAFEPLLARAQ